MARKIIITAAITGGIHTPSMSPYLPVTPKMIIEDALKAHEAGAATVHIHARSAADGRPTSDLNVMKEIISGIKKQCNAVICVTSGGAPGMELEERLAPVSNFKPELASCNAGSVNFNFSGAAKAIKEPKYDWEIPYLQRSEDQIFSNSFTSLSYYISTMNHCGTIPEYEVYDVGMIHNIAHLMKTGIVKNAIYLQFVMGILGGIPATVDNLAYLVKTAREELGDIKWSCAAAGRAQLPMVTAAMAMGGNVRVGLEDNLYLHSGALAKSSAEQVTLVKEIAVRMGFEIANAEETRSILGLKGIAEVNY
ncbi:MAG: kce 1 [Firmicutes bacterium]|nr:kce 1 [Bacillota bacterium]